MDNTSGFSTEELSNAFEDLPYAVLFNVYMFIPGIKPLASLQATCRRLYEIASEDDYLWENQARRYFPQLLETRGVFLGFYFALRSHVSEAKNKALTKLVNRVYQDADGSWRASITEGYYSSSLYNKLTDADRQILLNASEISFRGGHCIGPSTPQLLFSLSGKHSNWNLDTLDLRGMHLRAEGLETLSKGAAKLPFLRTLGLRENKLGIDAARSGVALCAILGQCTKLECLDLTDNSIGGMDGVRYMFDHRDDTTTTNTTTTTRFRFPQRLWVDQNALGTAAIIFLVKLATENMVKQNCGSGEATKGIVVRSNNNNSKVPTLLSLEHCGLGWEHTTTRAAGDASRSKLQEMTQALQAVTLYIDAFLSLAGPVAKHRAEAKEHRHRNSSKKKSTAATSSPAVVVADVVTKKAPSASASSSLALPCYFNNNEPSPEKVHVHSELLLGASSVSAAVARTQPTFCNSFAGSVEDELHDKLPDVQSRLGLVTNKSRDRKELLRARRRFYDKEGSGAELVVAWPTFHGPDAASNCVIC